MRATIPDTTSALNTEIHTIIILSRRRLRANAFDDGDVLVSGVGPHKLLCYTLAHATAREQGETKGSMRMHTISIWPHCTSGGPVPQCGAWVDPACRVAAP